MKPGRFKEAARVAWVSKDMNAHDDYMAGFMEVFSELDWWGPATPEATRRTLAMVPFAPETILEIGCGRGMATMTLAEATSARIKATDTDDGALNRLRDRVAARDLASSLGRINLGTSSGPRAAPTSSVLSGRCRTGGTFCAPAACWCFPR